MSIDITHLAVSPDRDPTETGGRRFRVEVVAVDAHTGRVLIDRRGDDALVWPQCVALLPPAVQQPFVTALAQQFVKVLAADAQRNRYQVAGASAREAAPPDAAPFAPALSAAERHRLYQLLVRVDGALRDAGAVFFLGGGGLLGAVRYGDLLPWDDDLDLWVAGGADAADLGRRLPDLVVEAAGRTVRVCHPTGFPRIDIRDAGVVEGDTLRGEGPAVDTLTPIALCLPPVRGRLGPVETNLPADAPGWAVHTFGPLCLDSALPPARSAAPRLRVPLAALPAPPPPPPRYEWVSSARLVEDAIVLAAKLPPDITAVAGLPRSGMIPASVLATHLQLPLYELTDAGSLNRLGSGSRGVPWRSGGEAPGRTFVVDDAVYDGGSLTRARAAMAKLNRPACFGAVYVRAAAAHVADVFARHLESPQLMEWNLLNNGCVTGRTSMAAFGRGLGCDLDGIVRHDEASGGVPGLPYLVPRLHPVPLIATGQPEAARPAVEGWLRQWGVKWDQLRMLPDGVPLTADTAARHKADHYGASDLGFFVESCPMQAALIHRWTGKPVICPRAGAVFSKTRPGRERLAHLRHAPRVDGFPAGAEPAGWIAINSVAGLLDLLAHVGPVRRMVEVGSYRGVSSEVFAIHAAEIVCVDAWITGFWAKGEADLCAVAADYPGVRVVRQVSTEAARSVPDGSLDFVYIDAAHDYWSVLADIRAWLPKVKVGGWIGGHDHAPWVEGGGVIRAVAEAFGGPERVFSDSSWVVRKR